MIEFMAHLIDKDALVAEIEKRIKETEFMQPKFDQFWAGQISAFKGVLKILDTLEVKEVDEQKERMSECPYRQVGCTMYEGYVLECTGACSWVVDYPKLKELKAQKGK